MATVSDNFDVKIRVIFPFLTRSLPVDDNTRINATGNFNFEPPPQVDTAQGLIVSESPVKEKTRKEKADDVKKDLCDLLLEFDKIQDVIKRRSKHITLKYDPELTKNEALADAEIEIFGQASGRITYDMYEQVLAYQEKINKYISHISIENGGQLDSVA